MRDRHDLLLLIDDRPIAEWSGIRRFLRPAMKFATRGLEAVDSYCTAWHDGADFEVVFPRGGAIWRSADGVKWRRAGAVSFATDAGFDVCMSRLERPGEDPYYVGAGIGATQCTIRQPRLFSMAKIGHDYRGKPVSFGSDLSRSPAKRDKGGPKEGSRCRNRPWEFLKTNWSLIPAGGDTCTSVYHAEALKSDVLTGRYNVCTRDPKGGIRWREIRGLELRTYPDARGMVQEKKSADQAWRPVVKTYLDLDSKSDRYRMQLYNLQARGYPYHHKRRQGGRLSPRPDEDDGGGGGDDDDTALTIGVYTVLNFPKAGAVPMFQANCSALRGGQPLCDTVDAFLATSRDGLHFDAGWVYAREPLVPRGSRPEADSKMVLGCGQPFSHGGFIYFYYVGYPVAHEDRPASQKAHTYKTLGARWPMHAMVGVQPDGPLHREGIVTTKAFAPVRRLSLLVEAQAGADGSMRVEVQRADAHDVKQHGGGEPPVVTTSEVTVPRRALQGEASFPCVVEVLVPPFDGGGGGDASKANRIRLVVTLTDASLYAIRREATFGHGLDLCDAANSHQQQNEPAATGRTAPPEPLATVPRASVATAPVLSSSSSFLSGGSATTSHVDYGAPLTAADYAAPLERISPVMIIQASSVEAAPRAEERFETSTPRPPVAPLTPHVRDDESSSSSSSSVLTPARWVALEARSASLFRAGEASGRWIPEAVKAQLQHWWDKGWSPAARWVGRPKAARDPHYVYEKYMMTVSIRGGRATLHPMVDSYKKLRVEAYMKLFREVAARDKALDVTFAAYPADGCPGNAETYLETCAYECSGGAAPRGLASCDRHVGFLPFCPAPFTHAARGTCCLRERRQAPILAREVLPPPLPGPVLCFQKDRHNAGAALLPEIQLLYSNMYVKEKHERDPVAWEDKLSTAPHFAGATTGPWLGPLNQRVRLCTGAALNSTVIDNDGRTRRTSTVVVAEGGLTERSPALGPIDCHLFTTPDLARTCHSPEANGFKGRGAAAASPFSATSYSWRQSLRFKYLLSLDGNGATCSRVFKILDSNSVLLKLEQAAPFSNPSELFYFAGLEAWKHFVPVTEQNLATTVDWLRQHDDVARNISAEGAAFARTAFSRETALHYTHLLLATLAALRR